MLNNKKIEKLNIFFSILLMTLLGFGICAIAKFYKDHNVDSPINQVAVADFYIDLVNEDKDTELEKTLSLENMNPGEERTVTFYIRNGYEKDGLLITSDVDLVYTLQFIHTNNLPLAYSLYDEDGNKLTEESIIDQAGDHKYLNLGEVLTYSEDTNGQKMKIKADHDQINYNKYTLKVDWDVADNDSKYVKEIDTLYLKVSSYQEEPEKK